MKKIINHKFIYLFMISIISCNEVKSQIFNDIDYTIVRKIDLYVIPLTTGFRNKVTYQKVKKLSTIKIVIKESNYRLENYEFLDSVLNLSKDSIVNMDPDYRIKCVIRKFIGRKQVLYFDRFGYFYYKGDVYRHEQIKSFVFAHLPCDRILVP